MKDIKLQIVKDNGKVTSMHIRGEDLNHFCFIINRMLCEWDASRFQDGYENEFECLNIISEEAQ